ncbi:hypothetical protein [Bacillus luti]|uniref:hypothetical protein n=1 Tax=Bacillus luti TaxID=2026191 RepID=UPI0037769E25
MVPERMFLGVPQLSKIQVYKVELGRKSTIKQMVFTNTEAEAAKVTITVNTVDIMKDLVVNGKETKVIDSFVVLEQGDTLSVQQEKENAINVNISGVLE